jgi:hypothetical protein
LKHQTKEAMGIDPIASWFLKRENLAYSSTFKLA